jgi:hypothetical protein
MKVETIAVGMLVLFLSVVLAPAQELVPPPPQKVGALSEAEAIEIATETYIYGYPLVTMEMTRRVMTNVEMPKGTRAPMGQLVRMRQYPDASFKDVTAPNADTLYTTGWMDVGKEPWVLSIPDAKGRYYLMPMLDGWTDVFQVPGKRTTGTNAQRYVITGPGWRGKVPEGLKQYKSPTSIVWLLGRIYCSGTPEDYSAVHAMQNELSIVPLSAYGKPYTPPAGKVDPAIDMKTPVRDQVNALSAESYFKLLAQLMKNNPPSADDGAMVAKMARLGIVPGKDFDMSKLDPTISRALQNVPKAAFEKIMAHFKYAGTLANGWMFTTKTGIYGSDYLQRALITAIGLGANRPQDAIYPTSQEDAEERPYEGANKYVIHFDKNQPFPPVNGFWSLTMYDAGYFFVNNPLNRYTLSSRNKFKANRDGSVDLYIQNESPGKDKESNWLPAPKDNFILMFRFYWPKDAIIEGSWKPPAVKKVQ